MGNMDRARQRFFEGVACMEKEDFPAAEVAFRAALAAAPGRVSVITNLTAALIRVKKYEEARPLAEQSIALDAGNAQGFLNLGLCLAEEGWHEEAIACYDKSLALNPEYASAWLNRGNVFKKQARYAEALEMYGKALVLSPDDPQAWLNQGVVLSEEKRFDEALRSLVRALDLKPEIEFGYGQWLHTKMRLCNWEGIEAAFAQIAAYVERGVSVTVPFTLLATPTHPATLKVCATSYSSGLHPAMAGEKLATQKTAPAASGKIRVGYFSADFHNHPGMSLMAELFEIHDRSRFEIYAFSFSVEPEDDARRRVAAGVDHYLDVKDLSDQEIVAKSRELGIDIAINRNGYTMDGRAGIFAHRAAPVQVNFLGYPGTLGADYIDYIVADPVLIPESYREYYTEKIAYLPHTYQPNDRKREISDRVFTRSELGLPEDGFVFCCFNNDYKLTPDVFDIWMRLLQQVPKSVLWLLGGNEFSARNLWREADRRGIAADRLVFAGRVNKEEHLSRHRQADLFVDTFYYNAHTTASDALWAGLPVVTCLGEAFASRVAASLLGAMGLPELVTDTREQYEALIVELATQPDKLAAIKDRLAQNRLAQPLFQTDLYARHLEKAFEMMVERQRQGLPPDHLVVPA